MNSQPAQPATTTSTTSQSAQQTARERGYALPTDRLGKVARLTHCQVYRDEQTGHDLTEAEQALAAHDLRAQTTRPARIARARALARQQAEDDGIDAADAAWSEHVESAEDGVHADDAQERAALAERAERARQRAADDVLTFTFKSLGRTRWRQAIAANPPTEEELSEWAREGNTEALQYSPEGLLRFLLAHAVVAPELEPGDIEAICDGATWNEQEATLLFVTAMSAQTQAQSVPSDLSVPPVVAARRNA